MDLNEFVTDIKYDIEVPITLRVTAKNGVVYEYSDETKLELVKEWKWEDFKKTVPDGEFLEYNHKGEIFVRYSGHRNWKCSHPNQFRVKFTEESIGGPEVVIKHQCAFCGEDFNE